MLANSGSKIVGGMLSGARYFSQSATPMVSSKALKFLKSQRIRQKNEARQVAIEESLDYVDPVLGRPQNQFITRIMAELKEPGVLVNNYEKTEIEKLISLAELTKQEERQHLLGEDYATSSSSLMDTDGSISQDSLSSLVSKPTVETLENRKEAMLRMLNLKNANNSDNLKLAIGMAREEFQREVGDTGSSEVQAAVATVRIHMMAQHCKEHKKDFANLRNLRILVQQRQSILKYLKRVNSEKYYWTITKLGLSDLSVEREFNLDRKYLQDYDFFGDGKQLVKESKQDASKRRKEERKKKKRHENLHSTGSSSPSNIQHDTTQQLGNEIVV